MAKVYSLPAIFVIENNQYGVATSAREATALEDLGIRSAGYNLPGLVVDGMNPLAVKRAIEIAKAFAANDNGPVMIEAKTYRYFHQAGGMPGSAFGYRTKKEEKEWGGRDPLRVAPRALIKSGILDEAGIEEVKQLATALIDDALDYCTECVDDERQRRTTLIPEATEACTRVMSTGNEFAGVVYSTPADFSENREIKLATAKSEAIARWMETDSETFICGEDVANMRGGPYGATRDSIKRFPERVLNAPIAEGGIVGMGHGAAVQGMRPIAEIMFCDFSLVASDELFNQVATCRYMYNGRVDVPLVVRSRCSTGRGYGAQHSGDTAGQFALYPGWRIVAPTTPFDYIGLFNTAMQSLDPVLVLEHHELDPLSGFVPAEDLDFLIPFGSASVPRQGNDLTVVTYLSLVPRILKIAEKLSAEQGIDIEIIDLRTLDYANIDYDTIFSSAVKTGQVVIAEQTMETQSLGCQIAAKIHERLYDQLKQPVRRLCSHSVPIPCSFTLERTVLISDERIRQGLLETLGISTNATDGDLTPVSDET